MKHECIIGIWNDYNYSRGITLNKLKERVKNNETDWTLEEYLDKRRSTNLYLFNHCPECGKKLRKGK